MKPYIVFDVNETLLNLDALDPHFEVFWGKSSIRKEWFDQVLLSAFSTTILGSHHHFGHIARTALQMVAERHGVALREENIETILGQIRNLPPHPDVIPAMTLLREAGVSMAALTNSPTKTAQDQVAHAGLTPFLDAVLSVDASGCLKPAAKVYQDAARTLDTSPEDLYLVAAHPWDIAGAMNAGWKGVFVQRNNKGWNPVFPTPTLQGRDMVDIARLLIS